MKQEVLKKHIGAIQINGRLTLLQRKVFNVLLLHAYPKLPEQNEFTISTGELARLSGFDSHNTKKLKSSFRALARTTVEWNILDGEVDEQWTTSALLADATVLKNRGLCAYSYSNRLKEKLYHPEIYAQINLKIQRQFKSAHALVLYENCARFRKVRTTGWISLDDWRKLFGIKDGQYSEFKAFSRRVIKTAVKEVNDYSDLHVTPEYRKEQGRVVAIKFTLKPNRALKLDLPAESEPALYHQLISAGVSSRQASVMLESYKPAHIAQGLEYLEKMIAAGSVIRSPGAYLEKAIKHNYGAAHHLPSQSIAPRDHASHQLVDDEPKQSTDDMSHIEQIYAERCLSIIQAHLKTLDAEKVSAIEADFTQTLDPFLVNLFTKRGWRSPLLSPHVIRFWSKHIDLPDIESIATDQGLQLPLLQ